MLNRQRMEAAVEVEVEVATRLAPRGGERGHREVEMAARLGMQVHLHSSGQWPPRCSRCASLTSGHLHLVGGSAWEPRGPRSSECP